eukprot:gene7889-12357_t
MNQQEELILPGYFPTSTKECQQITSEFFECFSAKAEKIKKGDRDIGQIGLQQCKEKFLNYKNCMDAALEKNNKNE